MSLREKLAQKRESEDKAKEDELKAQKAEEQAAVKEQFVALNQKREALAKIRAAAKETTEEIGDAKEGLRESRKTLRDIHQEFPEDMPAQPAAALRNKELRGEEEVESYYKAREAFKMSAQKKKELAPQLAALGIEDADSMLPGQLEAALESEEQELAKEIQTFVEQNPDADPEIFKTLRDEAVAGRTVELSKEMERREIHQHYDSLSLKSFYNSLGQADKSDWEEGGPQTRTFTSAVAAGFEAIAKSPEDRKHFAEVLKHVLGENEPSDTDRAALARALVKQMVTPSPIMGYSKTYAGLEDALKREEYVEASKESGANIKELEDEYRKRESGKREGVEEELVQKAIERLQDTPEALGLADMLVEDMKEIDEAARIPSQIRGLQDRIPAIERKVDPKNGSLVRELDGLERQEREASRQLDSLERGKGSLQRETKIEGSIGNMNEALAHEKITIKADRGGAMRASLDWQKVRVMDQNLSAHKRIVEDRKQELQGWINKEVGIFGGGEKKRELARIGTELQAANERVEKDQAERDALYNAYEKFDNNELKDLNTYLETLPQPAWRHFDYSGTVKGLAEKLKTARQNAAQTLDVLVTRGSEEKQRAYDERLRRADEVAELQEELAQARAKVEELRAREKTLVFKTRVQDRDRSFPAYVQRRTSSA